MRNKKLDHFLAVVKHGTLISAADAVSIACSALSRSMKSLEDDLDVALFNRDGNKMLLSDAGVELAKGAIEIQHQLYKLESKVKSFSRKKKNSLAIGLSSGLDSVLINEISSEFKRKEIKAKFCIGESSDIYNDFKSHKLDFVFVDSEDLSSFNDKNLIALFCFEVGFVLKSQICNSYGKNLSYSDLKNLGFACGVAFSKLGDGDFLPSSFLDGKEFDLISQNSTVLKNFILDSNYLAFVVIENFKKEINLGVIKKIDIDQSVKKFCLDYFLLGNFENKDVVKNVSQIFIDFFGNSDYVKIKNQI